MTKTCYQIYTTTLISLLRVCYEWYDIVTKLNICKLTKTIQGHYRSGLFLLQIDVLWAAVFHIVEYIGKIGTWTTANYFKLHHGLVNIISAISFIRAVPQRTTHSSSTVPVILKSGHVSVYMQLCLYQSCLLSRHCAVFKNTRCRWICVTS